MPRSSRSSGSRPSAGSSRPSPAGSRGAHTMAVPPPARSQAAPPPATTAAAHHAPPQQPGLFSQMASTAAGVAVGSTVGHGLSNMFFGGSSSAPAAAEAAPAAVAQPSSFGGGVSCDAQSKDFIKCLESTNDMNSCSYYLEQLKACQAAAQPY